MWTSLKALKLEPAQASGLLMISDAQEQRQRRTMQSRLCEDYIRHTKTATRCGWCKSLAAEHDVRASQQDFPLSMRRRGWVSSLHPLASALHRGCDISSCSRSTQSDKRAADVLLQRHPISAGPSNSTKVHTITRPCTVNPDPQP